MVPYDVSLNVHTVWDLGIGEQLVCGFWQRISTETRLIDSWQGEGSDGMPQAAVMLQRKPYRYGKHFAPHDSSKTATSTGLTSVQQAARLGIDFEPTPMIPVNDGITKALMMFPRLLMDETKNEQCISALRNYQKDWDEKRLDWKPELKKDWTNHYADMLRYTALVEDETTNETGLSPAEIRRIQSEQQRMEEGDRFNAL
jgi:phage terminase large subunit